MKKQIIVDRETVEFLCKAFNCTRMAVWYALNFERNSDTAVKIRHLALQRGGKLSGAEIEPETSFDADGTMTQTFGSRVRLVSLNGNVSVWVDGKVVEKTFCKEISEFVVVQNRVKATATKLYLAN